MSQISVDLWMMFGSVIFVSGDVQNGFIFSESVKIVKASVGHFSTHT